MPALTDLTNQRFGRLLVIYETEPDRYRHSMWFCQCDCGEVTITRGYRLLEGRAVSCGCARRDPEIRRAARLKTPARRRHEIAVMGGEALRALTHPA